MTSMRQQSCVSLLLVTACSSGLWAECSDSGFCRLPVLKSRSAASSTAADAPPESTVSTGLRAGVANGEKSESLTYAGFAALLNWSPSSATTLQVEIPWMRSSGNRGSSNGLGDVLVAANQKVAETSIGTWSASVGLRLPTGDDQALSGAGLGYQPGLGSTDVILAAGWMLRGFDARVGYIAALGRNDTPSIELERGDDVAAAAGYTLTIKPFDIRGGLQATHRLQNSTATDGAGGRTEINNSAGTQVNAQLGATWQASERWNLGLDAAIALMKRQENASIDGLTRSRSIALQAQFFW